MNKELLSTQQKLQNLDHLLKVCKDFQTFCSKIDNLEIEDHLLKYKDEDIYFCDENLFEDMKLSSLCFSMMILKLSDREIYRRLMRFFGDRSLGIGEFILELEIQQIKLTKLEAKWTKSYKIYGHIKFSERVQIKFRKYHQVILMTETYVDLNVLFDD